MPGIRTRSSRHSDSGTPAEVGKESPSGSEPPPGSRRRPPRSNATESEQSDLGSDAASEVAGSPSDHGADSDSGERRRNLLEDREFLGNLLDSLVELQHERSEARPRAGVDCDAAAAGSRSETAATGRPKPPEQPYSADESDRQQRRAPRPRPAHHARRRTQHDPPNLSSNGSDTEGEFNDPASGLDGEGADFAEDRAGRPRASQYFRGGQLPCPHDDTNPWPRSVAFRPRAMHYNPKVAGDTVHTEIYDGLKSAANQREMCTLVPTLSYLYDAIVYLENIGDFTRDLARLDSPGPADIRRLRSALSALATQLGTLLEFNRERLDELEALVTGGLAAETFFPMYHGQRTAVNARSALGQYLFDTATDRRHSSLVGASARLAARSATTRAGERARPQRAPQLPRLPAGPGTATPPATQVAAGNPTERPPAAATSGGGGRGDKGGRGRGRGGGGGRGAPA